MTTKVKIFENVFLDSMPGHRTTFCDQICWKSAVAKLPKGPLDYHTKNSRSAWLVPSPHFAQNKQIVPKIPWPLSPLDMSNIEPPALRRKAATDKLVEKIIKHDSWPIQPDILNPPLLQLTSSKPLWLDLQPVNIKSRWKHNWKSAQVVNSHLVCDPTIRQPGVDLHQQQWSLLNRFRTEQGHWGACKRKSSSCMRVINHNWKP